jgi:hypothetical protein
MKGAPVRPSLYLPGRQVYKRRNERRILSLHQAFQLECRGQRWIGLVVLLHNDVFIWNTCGDDRIWRRLGSLVRVLDSNVPTRSRSACQWARMIEGLFMNRSGLSLMPIAVSSDIRVLIFNLYFCLSFGFVCFPFCIHNKSLTRSKPCSLFFSFCHQCYMLFCQAITSFIILTFPFLAEPHLSWGKSVAGCRSWS